MTNDRLPRLRSLRTTGPDRPGRTPRPVDWRRALAGLVLATLAPFSGHAGAQQPVSEARSVALDAGPLADVLARYVALSGVQLLFEPALLSGRHSAGLSGRYSVREGLDRLLQGSGFEAVSQGERSFILQRLAAPASAARDAAPGALARPGPATLPAVVVTAPANAEIATGPVDGYVARRAGSATKTDTPIIETPQSVSVVTADQIRATRAQTLQQALGYTAGITPGAAALNPTLSDTFYIRGFQADAQFGSFYRDGMRYNANIYNGRQEPYGLERIEVLKGPASILFGAAAPGGVINAVSKRPQTTPMRELNLEVGSHERRQLSADLTGPIDADGVWSYRLTVLARDSETFIDHGKDDRIYVAPALTWRPTARTALTLLASHQDARQTETGTLPLVGTLRASPYGEIPRNRYLGEPGHNGYRTRVTTLGYVFEHAFGDDLTLTHALRRYDGELTDQYFLMAGLNGRMLSRQARRHDDETEILTSDTNLRYRLRAGAVTHTLVAGVDTTRSDFGTVRQRGTMVPIDVYEPVYGGAVTLAPWRRIEDNRRQVGYYLQDQIRVGRWVGLIGGRHDRFRNEDVFNGSVTRDEDRATTGRAGLVYLADNGVAPYASFSQSFNPTGGTDAAGRAFDPDRGRQVEVGVRYQPEGRGLLLSAALYQLTRSNVLTPDPVNVGFSVQTGEVRARGLELEAKARVARDLDLTAAYTYTDAVITRSNVVGAEGSGFTGTAKHAFAVWADLRLGRWALPGLSVGAGLRAVSDKPGNLTDGGFGVPGYGLVDARLGYRAGPWSLALNATNLGDRRTIPSVCYNGVVGCEYGEPRTVVLSASYRW